MKAKLSAKRFAELGIATTAIATLIAGCGGGGSSSPAASNGTTVMAGIVADGYLSNAKVCLDKNGNSMCDAGEPSGLTNAQGAYAIAGVTAADAAAYNVIAEIAATSVDADTGLPVGQAFTLAAPAGASFVSPLTTLVQDKVAAGATPASAAAAVAQTLGIPAASGVSVVDNYVALKGTATDQTNGHFRAHEAAKTVADVLKAGKGVLGSTAASTDRPTQSALLAQAEAVLQVQAASNAAAAATMFSHVAVNASSVAGVNTLKAQIAAGKANAAAATQPVTINFDLVNGATSLGITGCSTPFTLGTTGTSGTLVDMRFYISSVALIDANGNYAPVVLANNANQAGNVALLDFEDGTGTCAASLPGMGMMGPTPAAPLNPNTTLATYTAITGNVAPGTYVGIAFTLGVPPALNHVNPVGAATPAILANNGMGWPWKGGRKFTKFEFIPAGATDNTKLTMVHLGSGGCRANPAIGEVFNGCSRPDRLTVTFPAFNTATNKVALDIGSLFAGLDMSLNHTWMSGTVQGMMSDSPAYYFGKFGLDIANGQPVNDGAAQALFTVR